MTQEIDSGCIYISGAVEYDERDGPVRDQLVQSVKAWMTALVKATQHSVELGQLRKDTDPKQLVFEMHGLILALHHDARFLKQRGAVERARKGFDRLISSYLPQ